MTTKPTDSVKLSVIQADRDAAADYLYGTDQTRYEEPQRDMRTGLRDDKPTVQAFAAHRLRATDDLLDALEKKADDEFTRGYLIAVANLSNLHDQPTIAADVLAELGESEGVIKRLGLGDYDAKPLRKLFRENARRARYVQARQAARHRGTV